MSPDGDPLLADFGVSRMLAATLTLDKSTSSSVKGSSRWMAIELLAPCIEEPDETDGVPSLQTKESDVWALGMTFYVTHFSFFL